MTLPLYQGLIDSANTGAGILLGLFQAKIAHSRIMDKEREKTKRIKFNANIQDVQLAREDKSWFTFVERYTIILAIVGMVTIGIFIAASMHIPINIPIYEQRGILGKIFYGTERTTIITVQGLYIMSWLQYPISLICGFLFGGRR